MQINICQVDAEGRAMKSISCRLLLCIARGLMLAMSVQVGAETVVGQDARQHRRHYPLDGQPNFRDLGGYKTQDGRTVKWGQISSF